MMFNPIILSQKANSAYFCYMKIIRAGFDFYLNSSIHVGIEVCAFVLITNLQFDVSYDPSFIAFVFFGTITGYNFVKYAGVAKFQHSSLAKNLKLIQIFSLLCFLAFLFFAVQLPFKTLIHTFLLGIFTMLYAIPVFPGKKNLRSFYGLKIFVITFVVAGLTVIVPLVHHNIPIDFNAIVVFVQRMAFIIAVLIPFEIRDVEFDETDLGTIPQKVGVKKAKVIGIILLLVFVFFEFFKDNSTQVQLISAIFITLISAGFVMFSKKEQSKYYASFWVDGIPIFWLLILLAFV